jgi:hypothetical protein
MEVRQRCEAIAILFEQSGCWTMAQNFLSFPATGGRARD